MYVVVKAAPTASTACTNLYDTPVRDAVCAMPFANNNTEIMSACCKKADVVSYYNNCGLYCLAIDQSIADLTKCLYEKGAAWEAVFCRGNETATATATDGGAIPTSASASVVVTADASPTGKDEDGNDNDESKPTASEGAAPSIKPQTTTSLLGFAIGALLFSATAFGAIQI
ncbi:hypothetical protein F4779DRAFT_632338 [Xylariaceae sp. FL0662B]|nr:hypothetical protein F4779DRAFT_632338 [Xylariaceae sp. FL0662B]